MDYIPLLDLWLPILLSGVAVFIVSAIVWMALPHHKNEWKGLANEDAVMAALRGTAAGGYVFPYASSMDAMKDPAYVAKRQAGPAGFVTMLPSGGGLGMGKQLVQSFVFYLVVGIFVAYVASRAALPVGAHYLAVFRVVGTVAFLTHGFGVITDAIWFGKKWSNVVKHLADSLLYGLVTAGIFGTFWPDM